MKTLLFWRHLLFEKHSNGPGDVINWDIWKIAKYGVACLNLTKTLQMEMFQIANKKIYCSQTVTLKSKNTHGKGSRIQERSNIPVPSNLQQQNPGWKIARDFTDHSFHYRSRRPYTDLWLLGGLKGIGPWILLRSVTIAQLSWHCYISNHNINNFFVKTVLKYTFFKRFWHH